MSLAPANLSEPAFSLVSDAALNESIAQYAREDAAVGEAFATATVASDDPRALRHLADLLRHRKALAEAAALLQRAVRLNPDDAGCYEALGFCLMFMDRVEDAAAAFREASRLAPGQPHLLRLRATLLLRAGLAVEAEQVLRAALEIDWQSAQTYLQLSQSLFTQQKVEEAIAAARNAVRLQPDDFLFARNLSHILMRTGAFADAESVVRDAISADPGDAAAYDLLASILASQHRRDDAVAAAREAVTLEPTQLQFQHRLGYLLNQMGLASEAESVFRRMIAADPERGEWHESLATCLASQGRVDESTAALREAVRLAPQNPNYTYRLGDLLRRSSRLPDAEEVYRSAIAKHPGEAVLHARLAECLDELGRVAEALTVASEAVRLAPANAAANRTLGNVLCRQGKFAEAEEIYRQAIALVPDEATLHAGLSACLEQLGRQAEALEARRETVRLRPQDPHLLATFGELLLRYGRPTGAESYLRDAVALAPDRGLFHFWLSQCLARLGRPDEAAAELRRALELEPGNSNYRRTLTRLLVQDDTPSYSQSGEDILLARIFAGSTNGFYVDVGCNHPEKISNTYMLYQRGWNGICIDPHEVFAPLYQDLRPRDIFLPLAVSATQRSLDIYYGSELGLSSAQRQHHLINKVTVPARRLQDILDEQNVVPNFELLSVDVEGFEIDVLESLDFSVYRPRVIIAEYNNGGSANLELQPFLVAKGYHIIAVTEFNFVATSRFDLDYHACRRIE